MMRWNGHWALVTGASAGIGREFARQIAAAGLNVALVARRADALESLATEIRSAYSVDCLVLPTDLAEPTAAELLRSRVEQAGKRIRLLVNNAGAGRWGRFERVAVGDYLQMLAVNNGATVALCQIFFPHLSSFESSAVINVSSQAALQPVPYMATYAASKAFVQNFSLALYEEWRQYGIHVQTLIPGPTASEFDEKAGAYSSAIVERRPPAEAVAISLRGLERNNPVVASVKGIYKQRFFGGILPYSLLVREVAKLFKPPKSA
jgi:hypothetical protein